MNKKALYLCIMAILLTVACSVKEEPAPVDEIAGTDTDTAVTDTDATVDQTDPSDQTILPDETVDETVDTVVPDETVDTVMPDETATDADIVIAEGAYQQCTPGAADACPDGLECVKGYDDAQYGQCTKTCAEDTDCPPPPDPTTMQVACNTTESYCLILCGAHPSVCPDWLECFGMEMCLPPSSVVPTKGPGETCVGKDECIGDPSMVDCISGQSGIGHCYPICDPNVANDCANKAPGTSAVCTSAGSFYFCMFDCKNSIPCPGDLNCVWTFCEG